MPGTVLVRFTKRGTIMSHISSVIKNRHQKHPKVPFGEYLLHSDEPKTLAYSGKGLSPMGKSVEDDYLLRRRLRLNAEGVRTQL